MLKNKKNPVISTILARTCCRVFQNQPVESEKIQLILQASQAAPSAKNRQPWFFIVIKNKKLQKQIAQVATRGRRKQFANWNEEKAQEMIAGKTKVNSNDAVIAQAGAIILVFRNSNPSYVEGLVENLNIKEEQGVACACYSMMLAAEAIKLGAAWICSVINIPNELKQLLVPELKKQKRQWQDDWRPRAAIAIGYPTGKTKKPIRKKTSELIIRIIEEGR